MKKIKVPAPLQDAARARCPGAGMPHRPGNLVLADAVGEIKRYAPPAVQSDPTDLQDFMSSEAVALVIGAQERLDAGVFLMVQDAVGLSTPTSSPFSMKTT